MQDFTGNNPLPRPQPKIGIKDTTEVVCDKCQNNVFNLGIFKYTGRFSFGIYMLHPVAILYIKENIKKIKCKGVLNCLKWVIRLKRPNKLDLSG